MSDCSRLTSAQICMPASIIAYTGVAGLDPNLLWWSVEAHCVSEALRIVHQDFTKFSDPIKLWLIVAKGMDGCQAVLKKVFSVLKCKIHVALLDLNKRSSDQWLFCYQNCSDLL